MKKCNFGSYWPVFVASSKTYYEHALSGKHEVIGAISPNSGRPLLRLMMLDLRDEHLNGINFCAAKVQLFFS